VKPIAIVQHDAHDGPGYFGSWLVDQGIAYEVFRMYDGQVLPETLTAFAGLCLLGGPMSANDALPYYPHLLNLVRQAVTSGTPVIGHCLGGQLLCRALGGTVQASEHREIGWSQLEAIHPLAQQWFGTAPLQLFQWHGESFSIPSGAIPLLRGQHCANQAFVLDNRHLAMQFHCEVDLPKVQCWLELGVDEIRRNPSPGVQTADAILSDLEAGMVLSQRIAHHIYTRWARGLAP
jgi:GMP synthase-like glutamine amidotransferase